MLSKSWSTSKKRGRLFEVLGQPTTDPASLAEFVSGLFPLLLAHADDHGRLPGDALTIKLLVDPVNARPESDFERALDVLRVVNLIRRYDSPVDGRPVIVIVAFDAHQTLRYRARSQFADEYEKPRAKRSISENSRKVQEVSGNSRLREVKVRTANSTNQLRIEGSEIRSTPVREKRASRVLSDRGTRSEDPTRSVRTIARLILAERVTSNDDGDLVELVKRRAAKFGIPYTTATVTRAIKSARAQQRKAAH
jgi:hypothetical protein